MVLLTARTLNHIVAVVRLGQRFGCHPYKWNQAENLMELTNSVVQFRSWILTAALSLAYYMFVVAQWIRLCTGKEGKFDPFLGFALVFFAFPVFFHLSMIVSLEELPAFVNMYMGYNRTFEDRYACDAAPPTKLAKFCEFIVVYVYNAFWLDYIILAALTTFRPKGPEQVPSVFTENTWDSRRLVLHVVYVYYGMGYVTNACLMIFTAFGFFFSAFQILQEFGKAQSRFTVAELQQLRNMVQVYRALSLQVDGVDRTYRVIIAAAKMILLLLAVFCTYGGIRLHGVMAATMGIIGVSTTVFFALIMNAWSAINSLSSAALRRLVRATGTCEGGRGAEAVVRRQVGTLKPMVIPVFHMYVIDKALMLTVMKTICEWIIFLLVNF